MLKKWYVLVSIAIAVSVIAVLSISAEESLIPSWIKSTAGFWVNGQISDKEFVSALQWLIDNGILTVSQKDPELDQLEQKMQKRILEGFLEDDKNRENPPPVEVGYSCQDHFGDVDNPKDYGWRAYYMTVQNFDDIPHDVVIEVLDISQGGNIISSSKHELSLQPHEIKNGTDVIDLTAFSNYECNVKLFNIK